MLDTGTSVRVKGYGDDIKTGCLIETAIPGKPGKSCFGYLPLLERRDSKLGRTVAGYPPGLDLDKNMRLPIPGDDVDFASPETNITLNDTVTELLQESDGNLFALSPQSFVMVRTLSHP